MIAAVVGPLVWAAVVVLAGWRAECIVRELWPAWLAAKYPPTPAPPVPSVPVEVPPDLIGLAAAYPEAHQDDVLAAIREKYATLNDWNRVRRAMGVAEVPE